MRVNAVIVFDDDGPGPNPPRLYAGGEFTMAGGSPARAVARWDGAAWSDMSSNLVGAGVSALAVFDEDGPGRLRPALFAAGCFRFPGTVFSGAIRWDGVVWSPLGGGLFEGLTALAVHDDDGPGPRPPGLFVGGYFDSHHGYLNRWASCPSGLLFGDLDCDGVVNVLDVPAFALALTDPAGYAAQFPGCDIRLADMNGDTHRDGRDLALFVAALLTP